MTDNLALLRSPDFMGQEIWAVHDVIRKAVQTDPGNSFSPISFDTRNSVKKKLVKIDMVAEEVFATSLKTRFDSKRVRILGEESLRDETLDLREEKRLCVLVDIIDGTDLLELNGSGWCTAVVVFNPREKRVLASFVALPATAWGPGALYFTTGDGRGAFKKPLSKDGRGLPRERLVGPNGNITLRDAKVCAYTQKLKNWVAFRTFADGLIRLAVELGPDINLRFYNFAGNPMLVRLADNHVHAVSDRGRRSACVAGGPEPREGCA